MRVNRRVRRFHNPWGSRLTGSVCDEQWRVGDAEFGNGVNQCDYVIDKGKIYEDTKDKFVLGPKSIEKLRR